jgi:RNase adaptor protein for sRNA GlmZ degradation
MGALQIFTGGELHELPEMPRVTFTYNLSDLLDDPAHKPGAQLIELDGTDSRVQDFVFATEGALYLFEDIVDTVARQLARKDVVVLFLCRGGKHRSVAFGEALAWQFEATVTHHHKHLPRVVGAKK